MKLNDFITKLNKCKSIKTKYQLGKFMNSQDAKGNYLCDCSGLIKGVLWGYPVSGTPKSNGVPDVNSGSMINNYCTNVSTNISNAKEGWLLWLSGHVGIYLGNGNVVECTPTLNGGGVVYSKLTQRNWKKCGKLKWIDYSTTSTPTNGTIKVGSKVKIKTSAKTYSTGQTIPSKYKNKTYTVQQVKTSKALIKELYSWVNLTDLQKV